MPPTRFFLTNSNPPPHSPVIPPQNHSSSIYNSSPCNSPKQCDGSDSSGLYSPCSPNLNSPYNFKRNQSILSSGNTSDDESISSWPLSRPPSLSQFDMEGDGVASYEGNFGKRLGDFDISSSDERRDELGEVVDFGVNLNTSGNVNHSNTTSNSTSTSTSTSSSLPQLLMPKVILPSRKPFTTTGLKLGKLKILIAGDSGIGKTELIRAILESSKHIVHVDEPNKCHIPKDNDLINSIDNDDNDNDRIINNFPALVEISGSTKPYPLYLIAHHEKKSKSKGKDKKDGDVKNTSVSGESFNDSIYKRRKSLIHSLESATSSDGALSRNICFVDTPGYGQFNDTTVCINTVLNYLDNKFRETANIINVSSPQVINLLTSASSLTEFTHVDVCFYLILDRIKPVDVNYISQLSRFSPVIPLIAKSDQLQFDDIIDLKVNILKELKQANIEPFLYDTSIDEAILCGENIVKERKERRSSNSNNNDNDSNETSKTLDSNRLDPLLIPSAISSHRNDQMLASILMQPDYTIELVDSELNNLCRYIFSEHGSAWLRFIAAKKFVEWISTVQVSNSLHNHNILNTNSDLNQQRQLVPYTNCTSNTDPSSLEILPEFFSPPPPNARAQLHYARWAMQLEQVSRTENVIAVRSRQVYKPKKQRNSTVLSTNSNSTSRPDSSSSNSSHSRSRSTNPTSPTRPKGNISDSILNCDPLSLDKMISKAIKYTVGAISLLTTAKLFTWLYRTFAAPPPIVKVLIEPKPSENIFITALNSLGGGWSVLV